MQIVIWVERTLIARCPCSIALCFGLVLGHLKTVHMTDYGVYCTVVLCVCVFVGSVGRA